MIFALKKGLPYLGVPISGEEISAEGGSAAPPEYVGLFNQKQLPGVIV